MMKSIKSISSDLSGILDVFVRKRCTLTDKTKSDVIDIVDFYANGGTDAERDLIRNRISEEEARLLIMMSDYFASLAINENSYQYLYTTLALISIEDYSWDYRENTIRLAVALYIAKELSADPKKIFEEISRISTAKTAGFFAEFIERPEKLKSLNTMGLVVDKSGETIRFVPKSPPWLK